MLLPETSPEPFVGELMHHERLCQFHRATSSVLGTESACWVRSEVSLTAPRLLMSTIEPASFAAPHRHQQSLGALVLGMLSGGRRSSSRSSASWPRLKLVDLDERCSLFVSRNNPRLFGVLLPPDRFLLLCATTAAEALQWLTVLAACIVHERAVAPARAPLAAVVVRADGRVVWPTDRHGDVGVHEGGFTPLREPEDVARTATVEILELSDGVSAERLGLPISLCLPGGDGGAQDSRGSANAVRRPSVANGEAWDVSEVELEWFGMRCGARRRLLNDRGDTTSSKGSPIVIDFGEHEPCVFAFTADARVIALRHGPEGRLLLLRLPSAMLARQWGEDLASAIELCRLVDDITLDDDDGDGGMIASLAHGMSDDEVDVPLGQQQDSVVTGAQAASLNQMAAAAESPPPRRIIVMREEGAAEPSPASSGKRRPHNEARAQELIRMVQVERGITWG